MNSYNYRQNLQFTSDQPNFLKLLQQTSKPTEVEKQASHYSDEAPQITLGEGVLLEDAERFVEAKGSARGVKKESTRESFFRDKNVERKVEEVGKDTRLIDDLLGVQEVEPLVKVLVKSKQTFGSAKRKRMPTTKEETKSIRNAALLSFNEDDD